MEEPTGGGEATTKAAKQKAATISRVGKTAG